MLQERVVTWGEEWCTSPSGLLVPPAKVPARQKPVGLGLFAGAGGFDLGFTQGGFHMAAAVEFDRYAAATYLCNLGGPDTVVHGPDGVIPRDPDDDFGTGWLSGNHALCSYDHQPERVCNGCGFGPECSCASCVDAQPCEHFWLADIREVSGAEILDALGLAVGELDAVIGGPPCQGFSHVGKRNVMDPRNSLVFEFARIIRETQPKTFVLENVPGMVSMVTPDGIPVIDALCRQLSDADYGDYQALRKGLFAQVGAGIGTPYQPARRKRAATPDDQEELDLFGGSA